VFNVTKNVLFTDSYYLEDTSSLLE